MEQDLYAFWSYDQYPYCLWGKIDKFKGDRVYIESYQGWFKPFKILEGEEGTLLISKLSNLEVIKKVDVECLNVKFDEQLKAILPEAFKH